ncbi:hypothetical protein H8356DRAFT_1428326 [Neocallimastix lanati (nom. inval.)]|nr:hypothetical protein H8356DRAFT_1428326 [Neocallimastix sp. JGI-2020a]
MTICRPNHCCFFFVLKDGDFQFSEVAVLAFLVTAFFTVFAIYGMCCNVTIALVTIIELHFLLVIKEYYIEIKFIELEAKEKESKITTDADLNFPTDNIEPVFPFKVFRY